MNATAKNSIRQTERRSEYLPSEEENKLPTQSEAQLETLRNFHSRKKILRNCRPDWFARSCAAYQRIVVSGLPHGAVHLYVLIQEFSLVNVLGSDSSGCWEISSRKLAKLMHANKDSLTKWRRILVKSEYILEKIFYQKSGKPSFKFYVLAVLTDERIAQLKGLAPVPQTGDRTVTQTGDGSVHLNGDGSVHKTSDVAVPKTGASPVPQTGELLRQGIREEGGGAGGSTPPVVAIDQNSIPNFPPIQPGTFASTLRHMLGLCQQKIREIQKTHQEARRIFLSDSHYRWYLDQAHRYTPKSELGKKRRAEYLQKAEALKRDPSNYKDETVLTDLGRAKIAAWKAHQDEVTRHLASAQ